MDIPDMESVAVELYEHSGPFGAKGIGEIAANGPIPAILNAVYDALGDVHIDPPITAEKILTILINNEQL